MFVAKDELAVDNPYMVVYKGRRMWGRTKEGAERFDAPQEAIDAGKTAMPSVQMADRVIAEEV